VGVEDDKVKEASDLVRSATKGALAITLDLERYERM
jgi:hypothetical protein